MLMHLLGILIASTLSAPLVGLLGRRLKRQGLLASAFAVSALLIVLALSVLSLLEIMSGRVVLASFGDLPPSEAPGIGGDLLSVYMIVIFIAVCILALAFSAFVVSESRAAAYFSIILGLVTSMVGVVLSKDFFTLFVFWEAMCICSYALVSFDRDRGEAVEAGYKYLIMRGAGAVTILFGLSLLYGLTGTLNFRYLSEGLSRAEGDPVIHIAIMMLVVGFGLQAGVAPFHTWLPDALSAAPTAVSAFLSACTEKTGLYCLLRVFFVIFGSFYGDWMMPVAALAVLTMFVGNLSALLQDDLKRLLAYSTIANTGYILVGVAVGTQRALAGSIFHILNHAVVVSLLFLCVGAFIRQARTRSLRKISGVRRTMPVTSFAFAVGVLSLATFPFLNIFWSELMIIMSGWEAGMPWLSSLMIINLVFSAAYSLRALQGIAVKEMTYISRRAREAPTSMLIPILLLAFTAIAIGVYPSPLQGLAETVAASVL
jgi:proton-translocating NADH-quinone oxidoreductase chain N